MNKMIAQSHNKDLLRSAKRFKTNNAERPEYIHELLPALLIVNIYKFLGTEDSKNLMLEALKYFDDKSKHDPGNVVTDLFDQFLLFLNTTTEITKKERIIVIRRLIQGQSKRLEHKRSEIIKKIESIEELINCDKNKEIHLSKKLKPLEKKIADINSFLNKKTFQLLQGQSETIDLSKLTLSEREELFIACAEYNQIYIKKLQRELRLSEDYDMPIIQKAVHQAILNNQVDVLRWLKSTFNLNILDILDITLSISEEVLEDEDPTEVISNEGQFHSSRIRSLLENKAPTVMTFLIKELSLTIDHFIASSTGPQTLQEVDHLENLFKDSTEEDRQSDLTEEEAATLTEQQAVKERKQQVNSQNLRTKEGILELLRSIDEESLSLDNVGLAFKQAAKNGYADTLDYIHENYVLDISNDEDQMIVLNAYNLAAQNARKESLEHLNGYYLDWLNRSREQAKRIFLESIASGDLEFIEWVNKQFQLSKEELTSQKQNLMETATFHGHVNILEKFYRSGDDLSTENHVILQIAVQKADKKILKWLENYYSTDEKKKIGYELLSYLISEAVNSDQVHVLDWLYKVFHSQYSEEKDSSKFSSKALGSNGSYGAYHAFDLAVIKRDTTFLNRLNEYFTLTKEDTLEQFSFAKLREALDRGQLVVITWLFENLDVSIEDIRELMEEDDESITDIFENIIINDQVDILHYIGSKVEFSAGELTEISYFAAKNKAPLISSWIKEKN